MLHFQLYSGTLYRFSSELPSGMVSVSLAVTTKLSEGKNRKLTGLKLTLCTSHFEDLDIDGRIILRLILNWMKD